MRVPGAVVAVIVGSLLSLSAAAIASAHEGEGGQERSARSLVRQAVALLEAQPQMGELIADEIHDALDASDTQGVDLALVQRADEAFDAGDVEEAIVLLDRAIGETPPKDFSYLADERALPGSAQSLSTPTTVALLLLAVASAGVGGFVAWRLR